MSETKAIMPGSFDPWTLGHQAIYEAASKMFDEVEVVILQNSGKIAMFDTGQRFAIISTACSARARVIKALTTVGAAKEIGAQYIVRGFRPDDAGYELSMAWANTMLDNDVQTVFIPTPQEYLNISSTMVREFIRIDEFDKHGPELVPEKVYEMIKDWATLGYIQK